MASGLAKKLQIKPGSRVLVLNAPEDYTASLDLPEGAEVSEKPKADAFDVVHAFAPDSTALAELTEDALRSVKPGGAVWFSYPKRASKVDTDITRDQGWDAVLNEDWRPVSQFSVDDVWSALRWRPARADEEGSQAWQPRSRR